MRSDSVIQFEARILANVYGDAGLNADQVQEAYTKHLGSSSDFPTPADIIALCRPTKMYRMDSGPLGFGAYYPRDHWYVRQVARNQGDISRYLVEVEPEIAKEAASRANAVIYEGPSDDDEEDVHIGERRGCGFRRVSYDH